MLDVIDRNGSVFMLEVSVIGIGDIGRLVINKIKEYKNEIQTIYMGGIKDEIQKCNADIIIDLNENIEQSLKNLKLRKRIFIVGHLGEKEWQVIDLVFCKRVKEEEKKVIGVISFPFNFEVRSAKNIAIEKLILIEKELDQLILLESNLILRDLDKKSSVKEAFEIIAGILYSNLQDIFRNEDFKYKELIVDLNEKIEEIKKIQQRQKEIKMEKDMENWDYTHCYFQEKNKM